jgi:hypothetical protein
MRTDGVLPALGLETEHPANTNTLNANHAKCFRVMPRDSAAGYISLGAGASCRTCVGVIEPVLKASRLARPGRSFGAAAAINQAGSP